MDGETRRPDHLTEVEVSRMKELVQSLIATRLDIRDGNAPSRGELERLVNRAESLVWELWRREADMPSWVLQMAAARTGEFTE